MQIYRHGGGGGGVTGARYIKSRDGCEVHQDQESTIVSILGLKHIEDFFMATSQDLGVSSRNVKAHQVSGESGMFIVRR